jgi:hypothetical protein
VQFAGGVPTVGDRIAQEVVKRYLEPILEPIFHDDSYGYRPGRSAIDALRNTRQRCWRFDWVLDIDVQSYFDNIDWELLLKAVRHHTDCPWVLLYIERWLKAPVQMQDGSIVPRTAGTPHVKDPYPSYNGAKLPFELAVTIPRDRLRTRYGDGFLGAPLMLCRPSRTRWPDHGGADAKAQDNTPDAQGPGEP